MATSTQANAQSGSTLKAFEDRIKAQVADAKSKLDQFDAKAREKGAAAETATVNRLKTAKQEIDRKLQDLKATHDTHLARAKNDIEADAARFKTSVEDFGATFKTNKK